MKYLMIIINSVLFTLMISSFFSKIIDEHFKHLKIFLHVIEKNGLVISESKMSLFQISIRVLVHYISQETISPIERFLKFAEKFLDKIVDKKQL